MTNVQSLEEPYKGKLLTYGFEVEQRGCPVAQATSTQERSGLSWENPLRLPTNVTGYNGVQLPGRLLRP